MHVWPEVAISTMTRLVFERAGWTRRCRRSRSSHRASRCSPARICARPVVARHRPSRAKALDVAPSTPGSVCQVNGQPRSTGRGVSSEARHRSPLPRCSASMAMIRSNAAYAADLGTLSCDSAPQPRHRRSRAAIVRARNPRRPGGVGVDAYCECRTIDGIPLAVCAWRRARRRPRVLDRGVPPFVSALTPSGSVPGGSSMRDLDGRTPASPCSIAVDRQEPAGRLGARPSARSKSSAASPLAKSTISLAFAAARSSKAGTTVPRVRRPCKSWIRRW